MLRATLLLLLLPVAGCAGPPSPAPGAPPMAVADATWRLEACQTTLHVWLVPLAELRGRVHPAFEPAVFREQALDTPLGRVVFYLYDCAATLRGAEDRGRGLLGVLGVRVVPPPDVAPPAEQPGWATTPWVSLYLLDARAGGAAVEASEGTCVPWGPAEGRVAVEPTPLPDAPRAEAELAIEGAVAFRATMQGVPGQVENFSRPERYFAVLQHSDGEDLHWLDVSFLATLWETEGTVDYAPDSPWARAVGTRAYDLAVDHHAMDADVGLAWGARRGWTGAPPEAGAAVPCAFA